MAGVPLQPMVSGSVLPHRPVAAQPDRLDDRASSIVTAALDAIWIGEKTAEEALKPAVAEANAILQEEAAKG